MATMAPSSLGGNQRLLLQLLMMQMLQQQSQGQPQPSQAQQLLGRAQQARGAYSSGRDAFNAIKDMLGGGGAGAAASQLGGMSSIGGSAASTAGAPGFTSIGEMVGNGLYTPGTPALSGGMSVAPQAASGFNLAGIGSAGNYYLPALGAIGAFDLFKNQRTGGRGYLQGAASGAALGSYFGPWGAVIGGGVGLGMGGANELFDTNRFKTEGNKLQKLIDKGINIPESLRLPMTLKKGRKKSELINPYLPKDFIGNDPKYGWTNNKFAESRDVKDLRPEDIWGYSAFFDKYGNDWLGKFSEGQRKGIAQTLLDKGAVSEGKGTIDIKWTPELENEINQMVSPQPPPAKRPPAPISTNRKLPLFKR